jgi:hypothetical protein
MLGWPSRNIYSSGFIRFTHQSYSLALLSLSGLTFWRIESRVPPPTSRHNHPHLERQTEGAFKSPPITSHNNLPTSPT